MARHRLLDSEPGPGSVFTAVAVLSLALGIGANTAIFSLINTLMLRMLPGREPEQLVELLSRYPGEPRMNYFGWKFYEHFRDENHVFSDLIGRVAFPLPGEQRGTSTPRPSTANMWWGPSSPLSECSRPLVVSLVCRTTSWARPTPRWRW